MKTQLTDIARAITSENDIVIISHRAPDGDTIGSALALYRALQAAGKRVDFLCSDLIPFRYHYMFKGLEHLLKRRDNHMAAAEGKFIISVDIADRPLFGDNLYGIADDVDICIDHHQSHGGFGKMVYRDSNAAANCEIIYLLLKEMNLPITPEIAECLYTGITTDTGCFKYNNTTPQTYRIAADLLELGAPAAEINRIHFDTITHGRIALEKLALEKLEYHFDAKCVTMLISRDMMDRSGAKSDDVEGINTIPRQIEGSMVGVTIRERKDGGYKISMRSYPPVNSAEICAAFGGGGHAGAAGAVFDDSYEVVREKIVSEIGRYFEKHGII